MNTTYPRTSSLAVISLIFGLFGVLGVFGIFGVFGGFGVSGALLLVTGPAAVICGHMARWKIRRATPGRTKGDGMALTGLTLGWISTGPLIGLIILWSTGYGRW